MRCTRGLDQQLYPWGNAFMPDGDPRCRIWDAPFPRQRAGALPPGTGSVREFPANGYGTYGMAATSETGAPTGSIGCTISLHRVTILTGPPVASVGCCGAARIYATHPIVTATATAWLPVAAARPKVVPITSAFAVLETCKAVTRSRGRNKLRRKLPPVTLNDSPVQCRMRKQIRGDHEDAYPGGSGRHNDARRGVDRRRCPRLRTGLSPRWLWALHSQSRAWVRAARSSNRRVLPWPRLLAWRPLLGAPFPLAWRVALPLSE